MTNREYWEYLKRKHGYLNKNHKIILMALTWKYPEIYILADTQINKIKEKMELELMDFLKNNNIQILKNRGWIEASDEDGDYEEFINIQLSIEIETSIELNELSKKLNQLFNYERHCNVEVDYTKVEST